jgi:hypothetical protein
MINDAPDSQRRPTCASAVPHTNPTDNTNDIRRGVQDYQRIGTEHKRARLSEGSPYNDFPQATSQTSFVANVRFRAGAQLRHLSACNVTYQS